MSFELESQPEGASGVSEENFYLHFDVKFGPSFPIKDGMTYKELYKAICDELGKVAGPGSIIYAFLERTKKAMELARREAGENIEAYDAKIFDGTLWCTVGGCGSCQDNYPYPGGATYPKYYYYANCQAQGKHCEKGNCTP